MKHRKIYFVFILVILFLSINVAAQQKEIIAYFPQWGVEHQPYYIKHIEDAGSANKITILNYAFIVPSPDSTGKIIAGFMNDYYDYQQTYSADMSIDGIADDPQQKLRGHFNQLKKLKSRHPNLRITLSLGGWLGSIYFSDAALTESSREIFVNSCIDQFIKGNLPVKNGAGGHGVAEGIFDGFDIDWEYPISGGAQGMKHNKNDNNNLTLLYALFRKELDQIDPDLLLTAAVPTRDNPDQLFNITEDANYLDWYMLMTYDFYGGWGTTTGHLANLLTNPQANIPFSMDEAVRKFHNDYNIPYSKLIPGAAFYGRSWKNVAGIQNGFNQSGTNGPGIYEAGFDYYTDILGLKEKGYKRFWDNSAMAETMYNPKEKIFWTYDEEQSIALKARYVDAYDLRGMMFWEISGDDSAGTLVNSLYTRNMPDVVFDDKKKGNLSPRISILHPENEAQIQNASNLIINTKVLDNDGRVLKVEFFVDGVSIGVDTKTPFSWVWFNTEVGRHKLTCVATDNNGSQTQSKETIINITKH